MALVSQHKPLLELALREACLPNLSKSAMAFLRDVSSGLDMSNQREVQDFGLMVGGKRCIYMEEKAFKPESCWFLFCYLKESQAEDKDVREWQRNGASDVTKLMS